ncbi:MAG: OmpA family protein [Bacteroidota bacterium]
MATVLSMSIINSICLGSAYPTSHFVNDTEPEKIMPGTYLVVGVFEYEDNAKNFTGYVENQGLPAHYAFYPRSGYFYVYTISSSSVEQVKNAREELRNHQEFNDAWVFIAKDGKTTNTATESVTPQSDTPEELTMVQKITETDFSTPAIPSTEVVGLEEKEDSRERKSEDLNQQPTMFVKFNTFQYTDKKSVASSVKIVEGARSRNVGEVATGDVFTIDKSTVLDSALQIIPYAIGYQKVQFDLPLNITPTDSAWQLTRYEGDTLVMNIPLQRLKKGDIQIMFNTYFYGNSSVMRERSRYEIDELVKLLKEKPDMRIKLHGHTNGNGRGFIYEFSPESKNFFDLIQNKEHKKKGISSTKLSALRTETIKAYLEHKGISGDRIETEGWGGKKMLYPEDSQLSKNNIRVEIEILSE